MSRQDVSLDDKYNREAGTVLISGVQALVRLPLDQVRRDRRNGLDTAGFISGYRGSPLGGYDQQLERARTLLDEHCVHVQPGVNEDLAATAVWGSQQVNLHPGAKTDGVFGLWYGKAPGVDRCGDVFRHANMTGTSRQGGVLAVAGDDPLAKSSTLPCQSEFAFVDAEIPVLAPADIQDVLDLGLHGLALSRHSGLWVGMIALADVMDGSATIDVDPGRLGINMPLDDGAGRHITLAGLQLQNRIPAEDRMRRLKLPAARAYARKNRLNQVIMDSEQPRLGIAASGKNWQALLATLELLGIDEETADRLGLRLMKIAMPWPLEPEAIQAFAHGLETILVVEAKRPLIEAQLKDQLYHLEAKRRPAVVGKTDPFGTPLLPDIGDLDPMAIAPVLLQLLPKNDETAAMTATFRRLETHLDRGSDLASPSQRPPHFCSGCPHSRSTRVPDGSRAMAGIGCHIMSQLMGGEVNGHGRDDSYSQMGGEGVAWLGQVPFTETGHVFANLGDGTYHHSGLLAIRAAVSAKAPITYKILYNDAVAMTGGQAIEGPFAVADIARQVSAEGVERIAVVSEIPERHSPDRLPAGTVIADRADLASIQEDFRAFDGVSVLIFDQTCAAEKRRRRKRDEYPAARQHVVINDRVCEGCGDCSRQSHCLSVEPLQTPFGTKRRIIQASCNQDLSCTEGFCPSFVTITGGVPQKPSTPVDRIIEAAAALPQPPAPDAEASGNILVPGVGGTGVTTLTALLAMAAHLDERQVATADITGLAQKGGAVMSYLRFGPQAEAIHCAKMLPGATDLLLACDLVVAAGAPSLSLCSTRRTKAIANQAVVPTASFVLNQVENDQPDGLADRVRAVVADLTLIDAGSTAERLFGDRLYANMMLVGAAFQQGHLPLTMDSIERATRLNGVAVERNLAAFHAGRLLLASPSSLPLGNDGENQAGPEDLDALIDRLAGELVRYQDTAYADRYKGVIACVRLAETAFGQESLTLTEAAARNLFKLMAYKDEYEVARLHGDPEFRRKIRRSFGDHARPAVQLAPPLFSRIDPATGRPRKMSFGPWIFPVFAALAKLKGLRGTRFDPFGWMAERRRERQLIDDYEHMLEQLLASLSSANHGMAVEIARLPEMISGYGPIKAARIDEAEAKAQDLLARFEHIDDEEFWDDHPWLMIAAE